MHGVDRQQTGQESQAGSICLRNTSSQGGALGLQNVVPSLQATTKLFSHAQHGIEGPSTLCSPKSAACSSKQQSAF